ncbi:MAG: hypothetical protein ACI9AT_000276 [Ulvibacter sp.]|jgi:hypothetical protein
MPPWVRVTSRPRVSRSIFAAVAVGVYNCPQFAKLGPAVVGAAAGGVDYFGGQALGVVFIFCFLGKGVD